MRALTDDDFNCEKEMNALAKKLANSNFPLGMVRTAIMSAFNNDPKDLRKQSLNKSSDEVDSISFVHFYDPSLPKIFSEVKTLISRIFTSGDLRPIFGGVRIVDSLREPSNLTRTLQHSRFDGSSGADHLTGVSRCGHRGCMTCGEIMEVNELYFCNSDISFKIKSKMDCTVRNVIYALFCQSCNQSYIGETVNFRVRMNGHRSKTKSQSDIAEVNRHLFNCGGGFRSCPILKIREESKVTRLVMEDHLIKTPKPDLNRDQRNLLNLQTF